MAGAALASIEDILRRIDDLLRVVEDVPGADLHLAEADTEIVEAARNALRAEQERARLFGADMFPHPGWAILLHLFVAASEGHELDGDALSAAAGVPRPVALPHLARLVSAKLVRRQPHHHRPDATYLTLTPAGERALHEYLGRAPTNMDAAAA